MVKEKFQEYFREYREHCRIWDTDKWKDFEKRFTLEGFISYYETKKIKRTKEGYKKFFEAIFLDANRLLELINLKEEDLIEQSRINIEKYESEKLKKEGVFEVLFSILVGVICHFYLNWNWLFIIIGIYSFFKASIEVSNIKRNMTFENENILKQHPEIKKRLKETQYQLIAGKGCYLIVMRVLSLGSFAALSKFIIGVL
ncbi:MAG: hypothetical protein ACK5G0_01745 [Bacteroidota bacterium]|jgi:hypothetical protein